LNAAVAKRRLVNLQLFSVSKDMHSNSDFEPFKSVRTWLLKAVLLVGIIGLLAVKHLVARHC
jgi:hypothetical protein